MIQGLGIDVVEIARIDEMIKRWEARFVAKVFTPEEIAHCADRSDRAAALAARFAAKEAFAKALGTGWDANFRWKDFSTRSAAGGQPLAVLSPAMQKRLEHVRIHLSFSHSELFAAAVVILEETKLNDE